ncbi:interferon a3-like [Sphaeramia orbicularis]|uniref:Interferon a3-like n=1 Tax=Sphaeramia orbicularis TaxID=375764 RepID=A0A673ACH4_9TELE|nr:interferon a3-like [Sphaeramia orbicularis]
MFSNIFLVCLFVSLYSTGSSFSCKWMTHKFRQYSQNSLTLLDTMGNNSGDAEEESTVAFPNALYRHAFRASAEDRLAFVVQILEEITVLFEEDQSSASWEETTAENFVNIVTQQAHGLRSCIVSHSHRRRNKKLNMYFKRLSHSQMGHNADAWELIRKEVRTHLLIADTLVLSVLTAN